MAATGVKLRLIFCENASPPVQKQNITAFFFHARPPKDPQRQTTVLWKSSQCINLFAANMT